MTDTPTDRSTDAGMKDGWLAPEGWSVLALAGIVTIVLTFIALPLGAFALGLMIWLRYTVRVPSRVAPQDPGLVLAPADGRILEISLLEDAAVEAPRGHRITIATRLADAQLQRSPVAGRIVDNFLVPGLFRAADNLALARRDNERREISIETEDGKWVMLVQIGTATARQLVCRLAPGKYLEAGAPLGMARIGGMADLIVPPGYRVDVSVGMSVLAGETIVARRAD